MDYQQLIRTRKSVRTFDGTPLAEDDRAKLEECAKSLSNPYDIPVELLFLDAAEHGLSSKVIEGERLYVAGKVAKQPHCEEAFGYSFEQFVLFAWSLGVGTTWIGGTLDRELFEREAQTAAGELMPIVTPLGYPAAERSEVDAKLRAGVKGDERLAASELFFEGDFSNPLRADDPDVLGVLDAVRWAPSAANMQPTRVVRDGDAYHFFEQHTKGYSASAPWDVQKIDVGIALCHFMAVTGGEFCICDPGIVMLEGAEYIATVRVK